MQYVDESYDIPIKTGNKNADRAVCAFWRHIASLSVKRTVPVPHRVACQGGEEPEGPKSRESIENRRAFAGRRPRLDERFTDPTIRVRGIKDERGRVDGRDAANGAPALYRVHRAHGALLQMPSQS